MTIHVLRARQAVWGPIMAGVVETVGRATPIYRAALQGRLGRDPRGERFAALAARLPAKDQTHLWGCIKRLNVERAKERRAA